MYFCACRQSLPVWQVCKHHHDHVCKHGHFTRSSAVSSTGRPNLMARNTFQAKSSLFTQATTSVGAESPLCLKGRWARAAYHQGSPSCLLKSMSGFWRGGSGISQARMRTTLYATSPLWRHQMDDVTMAVTMAQWVRVLVTHVTWQLQSECGYDYPADGQKNRVRITAYCTVYQLAFTINCKVRWNCRLHGWPSISACRMITIDKDILSRLWTEHETAKPLILSITDVGPTLKCPINLR